MLHIIELVNIVDAYKSQKLEILSNPYRNDNLYSKFYKGVVAGKIKTEKEAASFLYNDLESNINFKKLKFRFKKRLLNSLFLIDSNQADYTNVQKAYYTCYRNLASINILLGKGAKKTAIDLADKTLRTALKFEFTELVCSIARVLRLHYANFYGNRKKFKSLNKLYKTQIHIRSAESEAEEFYSDLIIQFVGTRENNKEYLTKAKQYILLLSAYQENVHTFKFIFFNNMIKLIKLEMENDHLNIIKVCQEAYKLLKAKVFHTNVQIFPFIFKAFYAQIKLCNYNDARNLINPCKEVLTLESLNWFRFNQIYFIYLMRTEQYASAIQVKDKVIRSKNFKFQNDDTQETWRLYEAYAHLVKPADMEQAPKSKFKIGKFLNEMPVFTKDKKGINISILIIQILLLLKQNKFNRIIDKMTGLERYGSRYLKKNNFFRSNCFIKMLLQVEKQSFNINAIKRHSNSYLKRLKEVPLALSDESIEVEIIPYEILWEITLTSLKKD